MKHVFKNLYVFVCFAAVLFQATVSIVLLNIDIADEKWAHIFFVVASTSVALLLVQMVTYLLLESKLGYVRFIWARRVSRNDGAKDPEKQLAGLGIGYPVLMSILWTLSFCALFFHEYFNILILFVAFYALLPLIPLSRLKA